MTEEDQAPQPVAAAAGTKTPDQWADSWYPRNKRGKRPFEGWKHDVADQLHGWSQHAYHEGKPMQLSAADYTAAIVAAIGGKTPHAAALSKHKPQRKPKEAV